MPKTTGLRDRERYLVARLAKKIPSIGNFGKRDVRLGIGDDSAVLRPSVRSEFVVSCDFSLEGVHFRDAIHPAVSIGYRCLARATSDIAAMGARPRYFLLALALPAEKTLPAPSASLPAPSAGLPAPTAANWLDSFSSGLARAARELGLLLIGGDITVSPSVTVCITVIGELPAGLAISRSGARPGDFIYVTGTLGAAQLGLQLLLRGVSPHANRPPKGEAFDPASPDEAKDRRSSTAPKETSFLEDLAAEGYRTPSGKHAWPPALKKLLEAHLYPRIPIAFAQALARRRIPSAMMDTSDGLSTDLARLCQSSRVGARLHADRLPCVHIPSTIANYYRRPDSTYSQPDSTYCHSEPMRPASSEESALTQRDLNAARLYSTHCHSEPMRPASSEESAFRPSHEASNSAVDTSSINLDPLQLALHGGEDYALLFTVPPNRAPHLRTIAAKTKTRITQIGEITRSRKVLLIDPTGHESPLEPSGWDPFRVREQ